MQHKRESFNLLLFCFPAAVSPLRLFCMRGFIRAAWFLRDACDGGRGIAADNLWQTADEKPNRIEFNAQSNVVPKDDLFAVWDIHGGLIAASPQTTKSLDPITNARRTIFFSTGGREYRGEFWRSRPLLDQESDETQQPIPLVNLAYAMPASALRAKFLEVTLIAVVGGCSWLALSSVIAWFSVSKGLAPLDELALSASRIDERSWVFQPSASATSISELMPLSGALQSLVFRLKDAFERERRFVSDAAHELKTAVAIQKSTLQVAANGTQSISDYRRGFEQALSDTDRLEALVLRMLSLASVEGSAAEDFFVPTPLNETLVAACEQVEPLAKLRGIKVGTNGTVTASVRGDAALMTALWVALIENAIQHSPPGSSIDLRAETRGSEQCEVTIRDFGEGIPPKDLPHVFDRFYRADHSRSRGTGGYGLGLSIAKAIVERHQGSVSIESTLGVGTTVLVQLPLV